MSLADQSRLTRLCRWLCLLPVALIGLSSALVVAAGVDANEMQISTGTALRDLQAPFPLVIDCLERLVQLLGVLAVGLVGLSGHYGGLASSCGLGLPFLRAGFSSAPDG
jgi:hypothetical protein